MHWANELAEKVIAQRPDKEEYVCAAGVSPSGSVHIGNFRDIATSLFVVKALQKKGKKAKLLLSWDDFDRLRKVPSNIASITQNFEENIGKPYTFIADPFQTDESYALHFEHEFEKSLQDMGITVDVRRQTEYYTSGKYVEQVKFALSKRKEIYDIIMSFKTQDANADDREKFFPISVYCDKSHKDNTKVLAYDEATGELEFYCADCKTTHVVNINSYFLVKLMWKIDWAMRWKYEGVDFEPGGIDHASVGGSYDVSTVICREIFGHKSPVFQGYGWLGIRGLGSMHSSTGNNITPAKILEIYEPELVKWLFAKYKPEDAFDFAFDDTVNRHYSEYDKLIHNFNEGNVNDAEKELVELLFDESKIEEKTAFGSISALAPIVDFNAVSLKTALARAGVEFKANSGVRLEKVKNWIEVYNPSKKYVLLNEFNAKYYATLSDEHKATLHALADFVEANEFTEKEIQQYLYDIINDATLTKKENVERQKQNFKNFYNMLFGRDDGPRLYLFLAAANKSEYINLIKN